jgi:hypothetical protein
LAGLELGHRQAHAFYIVTIDKRLLLFHTGDDASWHLCMFGI